MDRYWQAAAQIVMQQAGVRPMTDDEIVNLIRKTAAALHEVSVTHADGLKDLIGKPLGVPRPHPVPTSPRLSAEEAIQEHTITCLRCGEESKILSPQHLASHGLTPEAYREEFGYPPGTPLMCLSLSNHRSETMKKHEVWKKRTTAKSPDIDPKDAITEDYIICMECGAKQQSITSPHLRKHGLTVEIYREKWGYPDDMPLMSKNQLRKQAKNAKQAKSTAKPVATDEGEKS